MNVDYRKSDLRGSVVHVVPLTNNQVRMAAERVVLVPYWDAKRRKPQLLAHVWYDFVNEGPRARLELGFPELKAFYRYSLSWNLSLAPRKVGQSWTLPTISSLGARVGSRFFTVRAYPGVGRYRRWFTFGIDLDAAQKKRVHTTYLSTLGQSATSFYHGYDDYDSSKASIQYLLHYILHTGAQWRGPIGKGEILLYHQGRLRSIRRFVNLEPTVKDDLGLELDVTVDKRWDCGQQSHWHTHSRLDLLRLLSESGHLASDRVDTHVGLVVDGDPETQWVSPKGDAKRSFVQLPSDPHQDLKGVRVLSGQSGAGRVRPARVALRCVTPRETSLITRADLPDSAGPHLVSLAKPARCHAVRVEIAAVHGDGGASVAIAELGQVFGAAPGGASRGVTWKRFEKSRDPLGPADPGSSGAARSPRAAGDDPQTFAVVDVDRVMWSADGTLLHYWLQLENVGPKPAGVRLGYFVDVATGKVVRAYRLDRVGKLPEPYRRHWDQALTFLEGEALLRKHGFQEAKTGRASPRGSPIRGQAVQLRGVVKGRVGGYWITPTRRGFKWSFGTWSKRHVGLAETSLRLQYLAKGEPKRLLTSRAPQMDLAFAARHAEIWQERRAIFDKAVKKFVKHDDVDEEKLKDPEDAPVQWQILTYRYRQAYSGEARLFWHPRGEALAAFWIDRKDWSSLHPDPEPGDVIPECAWLPIKVCPWERRDEPRHKVALTVHAFVPRQPTTLLKPYAPPPAPRRLTAATMDPAAGPAMSAGAKAKAKPRSGAKQGARGCGCYTTGSSEGGGSAARSGLALGLPLFLLLLLGRRARRRCPRRGSPLRR
ncbi:MAG: hypothetical protein ABI333_02160 [bacterium]